MPDVRKPTVPERQENRELRLDAPDGSQQPLPSDHLKLLIELMKPAGPELARRWVAALMLVPEGEREQVVEAVEAQIHGEFGA